jgi:hypothetical protein
MMMRAKRLVLGSIFPLLLYCASAPATTLMRMSLARMSQAAPLIVRAHCVANIAGWDAGEIWTFTTFQVDDVWKGSAPTRITVRLLGGRAGNLESSVSGVPRFSPGEEVVLFLELAERGELSIVSWVQGTFRIRRDRRTGEQTVLQDSAAFATFDPITRRFEVSGIQNLPLGEFRAKVAAALADPAGRKP